jgi:hypothetical protein
LTAIFSYLYKSENPATKKIEYELYKYIWIFFASVGAMYSYYWDLKYDWGFLEPNSKFRILRSKLSYHSPFLYYNAMWINAILRGTFALSLS